jgi:predicted DNA-binding transcriptional regulator YafY
VKALPKKLSENRSYGEKLIRLFAALLFTGRSYSLTELAKMLECSKQTVLRLVDDVTLAYDVPIKSELRGNRRFYGIDRPRWMSAPVPMTPSELSVMQMCQTFTTHLLGREQFEAASRAIQKSQALSPGDLSDGGHFAALNTGKVDYTPHGGMIRTLMEAMDEKLVCKVMYKKIMAKRGKTFHIKPLKLISHQDTLYLHCRKAKVPGKKYKEPDYDPLLAVHRIQKIELTDTSFEYPTDYDFEKAFNQNFGVIKEEPFEVTVEFTGWSAEYVAERIWSDDQRLEVQDGKVTLTLTATSVPEVIGWVLWFGGEAEILKPDWLRDSLIHQLQKITKLYISQS